jgi:hypothetical protein
MAEAALYRWTDEEQAGLALRDALIDLKTIPKNEDIAKKFIDLFTAFSSLWHGNEAQGLAQLKAASGEIDQEGQEGGTKIQEI